MQAQSKLREHPKQENASYDWMKQASSYSDILNEDTRLDISKRSSTLENLGYSIYRASMQSDTRDEFRNRISRAISAYRDAARDYSKMGESAQAFRCQAMATYLHYWLSHKIRERKRLLTKAWRLTVRSLAAFRRNGDNIGFGRTYNQIEITKGLWYNIEWSVKIRRSISEQAIGQGEEAVKRLSNEGSREDLARAFALIVGHLGAAAYYSDAAGREKLLPKSEDWARKSLEASESAALLEMVASRLVLDSFGILGSDKAIATLEKALEYAIETKDKFVISSALDILAYNIYARMLGSENPNEFDTLTKRWRILTRESSEFFSPISEDMPRQTALSVVPPNAEYYWHIAQSETDDGKRLARLEAAIGELPHELAECKRSGIPEALMMANHVASKVFTSRAKVEKNPSQKLVLLRKALWYRKQSGDLDAKISSKSDRWNRGLHDNYLADIELDRATSVNDPKIKTKILLKAILLKENCLKLCGADKYVLIWTDGPSPYYGYLGRYQLQCGEMYTQLFDVRREQTDLKRADEKFRLAADSFQKVGQRTRAAESYWKKAKVMGWLNEHIRASEGYILASNNYNIAAQKIPSLKKFYEELAYYMQGQSEVEKANHYHQRRKFSDAKECYERAASLHISSKTWSYLAPYYSAWENMENAEENARHYRTEDSIQSFEEAVRLFEETARSIRSQPSVIKDEAEQAATRDVIVEVETWEKYSTARIIVEQARAAVRTGDLTLAWRDCEVAIRLLEELRPKLKDREEASSEVAFVIRICKGCKLMSKAETESSPKMFADAAKLFESWGKLMPDYSSRMLILGHSHYCKALGLGIQYSQKKTRGLYAHARSQCETAADYYLKGEYLGSSEYARATASLFDAYFYMDTAGKTSDPGKRAQLYTAAEKLLAASSGSYSKAGYSEKKEHVHQLLERARKDREIAISLMEALGTPVILSTPPTFGTIGPGSGLGAGPEKLATAYVRAEISLSRNEPRIGEDVEVRILIANAGNRPAVLLRLEEIVPKGFEIKEKPDASTIDGNHLSLRVRRLAPLKSEELKLIVKPLVEGSITLRPKLVYLDETGQRLHHYTEPLVITMKDVKAGEGDVKATLIVKSTEYFTDEKIEYGFELSVFGSKPVMLETIEDCIPEGSEVSECKGGSVEGGRRVNLRGLQFQPGETHKVTLLLQKSPEGRLRLSPRLLFGDGSNNARQETIQPVEFTVHAISSILQFLAGAFNEDYSQKRLSPEQSGWRTLMNIVSSLRIPRSQAYGEPRYGHSFGKPVEKLLRAGLAEYRTFPGRGRGGSIVKVRIVYERESVRRLIERLQSKTLTESLAIKTREVVLASSKRTRYGRPEA